MPYIRGASGSHAGMRCVYYAQHHDTDVVLTRSWTHRVMGASNALNAVVKRLTRATRCWHGRGIGMG